MAKLIFNIPCAIYSFSCVAPLNNTGVPVSRHSLSKKQLSGCGDALLSGVQEQLRILGDDHVGYSSKQFPNVGISVVGARPFSAVSLPHAAADAIDTDLSVCKRKHTIWSSMSQRMQQQTSTAPPSRLHYQASNPLNSYCSLNLYVTLHAAFSTLLFAKC